jgi:hypothetical protein
MRQALLPLPQQQASTASRRRKSGRQKTQRNQVQRQVTPQRSGAADVLGCTAALAIAAAWFSAHGMMTLFPGAPLSVVAMPPAMEAGQGRWDGLPDDCR